MFYSRFALSTKLSPKYIVIYVYAYFNQPLGPPHVPLTIEL